MQRLPVRIILENKRLILSCPLRTNGFLERSMPHFDRGPIPWRRGHVLEGSFGPDAPRDGAAHDGRQSDV